MAGYVLEHKQLNEQACNCTLAASHGVMHSALLLSNRQATKQVTSLPAVKHLRECVQQDCWSPPSTVFELSVPCVLMHSVQVKVITPHHCCFVSSSKICVARNA